MIQKLKRLLFVLSGKERQMDNDRAQAQIMGIALAAVKAGEISAQLHIKQAKTLEVLIGMLVDQKKVLAHYTVAAGKAKNQMDGHEPGSLEYDALLHTSKSLYELAAMLEAMQEPKEKKNNDAKNTE